ncbi:MAG: hypothetical protein ACK587_00725 [Cyanobacteriota bacterium]
MPLSLSNLMWTFIPKCHCLPLQLWCISGPRFYFSFFVELGAAMMVASMIVSFFIAIPLAFEVRLHGFKNLLTKIVLLQQIPGRQDRGLIRYPVGD